MRCPRAESALTRWVSECVVHLSRLIGSPLGSNNSSRSPCKVGSVSVAFFLPPPTCRILPCSLSLAFELFDPSLHGFPVRSRERCYLADASRADLERFCSQIQAPLLFIQFVVQDGILLLCRHALILRYFSAIWKL